MGPVYPLCLSRRSVSPDLPCRSMSSMSPATYPSDGAFSMSSGFRSRMVLSWSMHESRMIPLACPVFFCASRERLRMASALFRYSSSCRTSWLTVCSADSSFLRSAKARFLRSYACRHAVPQNLAVGPRLGLRIGLPHTGQIRPYRLSKPRFLRLISEAFNFSTSLV